MIFDKATVIAGIKDQLRSAADKGQIKKIERSLSFALDDYTLRLADSGLLTDYDVSISAGDRTVSVPGENDDLKYLFMVKYGTGDNQRVIDFVDKKQFLRNHDSPTATAGTPRVFTVLSTTDGFPVLKFNVPALAATTITVYYWLDMTPENIGQTRSGAAITVGAVAWFYGIGGNGAAEYAAYEELASLSRGSDHFLKKVEKRFGLNRFDRDVRVLQQQIRMKRT